MLWKAAVFPVVVQEFESKGADNKKKKTKTIKDNFPTGCFHFRKWTFLHREKDSHRHKESQRPLKKWTVHLKFGLISPYLEKETSRKELY